MQTSGIYSPGGLDLVERTEDTIVWPQKPPFVVEMDEHPEGVVDAVSNETLASADPEWPAVDGLEEESPEPDKSAFNDPLANRTFHLAIATRTIIAAARAGQLRRLNFSIHVQEPFTIRALLPYWVHVEKWGQDCTVATRWGGAATALRPFLVHASHWFGTLATSVSREQRLLSRLEVQALQLYFNEDNMPKICRTVRQGKTQPITPYLAWLAEDEDLAQQVSDAWSAVCARGEADLVRCPCLKCSAFG